MAEVTSVQDTELPAGAQAGQDGSRALALGPNFGAPVPATRAGPEPLQRRPLLAGVHQPELARCAAEGEGVGIQDLQGAQRRDIVGT